jgi:prohibitin 1
LWFIFAVDGDHQVVIFDRFSGVENQVAGEGMHYFIPWIQRPVLFDIRSRPRNVPVVTGSKGNELLLNIIVDSEGT